VQRLFYSLAISLTRSSRHKGKYTYIVHIVICISINYNVLFIIFIPAPLPRCILRSTALFNNDPLILKLKAATKISHAWETCKFWDIGTMTGIPAHIVTYVNQERIIHNMNEKFNEYADMLVKELDKRQMGGNLSIELIRNEFTNPLTERLEQLGMLVDNIQKQGASGYAVSAQGTGGTGGSPQLDGYYLWDRDNKPTPRCVPEDFSLDPAISPLLMWQHWHHGLTLSGNRRVRPLKDVPTVDYPSKPRRTYQRMKAFCRAIDSCTGVLNLPSSIADITAAYNSHVEMLREEGILLPAVTNKGRKRSRNENGWNYIAHQFEKQRAKRKRADAAGLTLEEFDGQQSQEQQSGQRGQHHNSGSGSGSGSASNRSGVLAGGTSNAPPASGATVVDCVLKILASTGRQDRRGVKKSLATSLTVNLEEELLTYLRKIRM